ncbi:MAG: diguanylate cyclase [Selenomonadaceae bacterium]|nr:diguanylate cyclase [Selenomonadaceae bacterium]
MKRLVAATILSFLAVTCWDSLWVMPKAVISLAGFLPPLLGLLWGPWGIAGTLLGRVLADVLLGISYPENLRFFFITLTSATVPYFLWHHWRVPEGDTPFTFHRNTLRKFILIILFTTLVVACGIGFTISPEKLALLSDEVSMPLSPVGLAAIVFLNHFDVTIFFTLPLFFILISYRYPFYSPVKKREIPSGNDYAMNSKFLIAMYLPFLGLFAVLDISGIIPNLTEMDTWLLFNGEIMTAMALTVSYIGYMLIKYRRSIMTNFILMGVTTLCVSALLLGSISFAALDNSIGTYVNNDLEKMSVIYRERLARTFNYTITVTSSLGKLAKEELTDYEALKDSAYRAEYLATMERCFRPMVENSPGSVSFFFVLSKDLGGEGFMAARRPEKWGGKLPKFSLANVGAYTDRYHSAHERYLANLSDPYFSPVQGGYIVSYVIPLWDGDNFIGNIGVDIDFNYVIHEIQRMSVYEHGLVCLLDKHGELLYASQPDAEDYLNQRGLYQTETYLSNGIWLKIAAFSHDIYADRNRMLIHFAVTVLFIVIAVIILDIWLVKRGIRPLVIITEAAKKIAAGDLEVKLPPITKNELGTLVASIKEMVSKLEIYVYRDKLTGLRNVAAYTKKCDELEERQKQAAFPYGVVVCDANFLKRTNDTYGHEAGNELIRRASGTICRVFAHSPVFRIGGDEFVAILEHRDYENREELLKEFDRQIGGESFEYAGSTVSVSVARGLGVHSPGLDYAAVFKMADAAMYEHKTALKAART